MYRRIGRGRVLAHLHAPPFFHAEREGDLEMKKLLLASACVLALGGTSNAYAQGWAASLDGDWNHTQYNVGPGSNFNGYDVNGAVDLPWDFWGIGLELNAGSHEADAHNSQGGGSLIWNGIPNFRLAGTFVYNSADLLVAKGIPEWQTGVGVEWYATPWLTASVQGGGIEGKTSGGYVGGTLKGYICPDLSLAGYINYFSVSKGVFTGNETDFGVKGEWLFWQDMLPLALTARYEHTHFDLSFGGPSFTANPDTVFVGLKLYLDEGMAPKPLVERNRTGTLDTIGPIAPLGFRTLF